MADLKVVSDMRLQGDQPEAVVVDTGVAVEWAAAGGVGKVGVCGEVPEQVEPIRRWDHQWHHQWHHQWDHQWGHQWDHQ